MGSTSGYRGRFAPTPSGPLHLGSLITALASYLEARSRNGVWLLRIDDLDRPRCPPGMDARILRQLEAHGLAWDEAIRRQTECVDDYREALEQLRRQGRLYACTCTRDRLKRTTPPGPDGPVYPGTCRESDNARGSLRLRVEPGQRCFDDGWQGRPCRDLEREVGDFVVARADGEIAYQLACAVDESRQRITDVVRGADLLGSTFQQNWVQHCLGLPAPRYAHLPVLCDARGRKLSKQNHAAAVEERAAVANLETCLRLLGQTPPAKSADPSELLAHAVAHWDATKVPRTAQIAA